MELWSRILGRSNAHAVNMKSVMKLEKFHAVESLFWSLDYCIGSCPIICHLYWSWMFRFLIESCLYCNSVASFFVPKASQIVAQMILDAELAPLATWQQTLAFQLPKKHTIHDGNGGRQRMRQHLGTHRNQPTNLKDIYIYLEPKLGPFVLLEKGLPCFGGLSFKNRGCLGARYIVVHLGVSCNFPPPWHGSQCLGNVLKKGHQLPEAEMYIGPR